MRFVRWVALTPKYGQGVGNLEVGGCNDPQNGQPDGYSRTQRFLIGWLSPVIICANEHNIKIHSVDIQEPNLEAVFLHLTGRALRD